MNPQHLNPAISNSSVCVTDAPVVQPAGLRFGEAASQGVRWLLKRNCSATPAQLIAVFASVCGISTVISVWFYTQGAVLILPFALLEVVAVGTAFLVYARHAADHERLELAGESLEVVWVNGNKEERVVFNARWTQVEHEGKGLVSLQSSGKTLYCGRYLRPERRRLLAREIRRVINSIPAPRALPLDAVSPA